tara:strand:+ start:5769 stop:6725 length:957 start_codon:yes stop_codon:yes gene_type:complete
MIKLLFIFFFPFFINANESITNWDDWILKKKNELSNLNFKQSTINYLDQLNYNKKILELDKKQPEKILFFEDYKTKVLSKQRLAKAVKNYYSNKNLFDQIYKEFNVSPSILISLWALETSFGKNTGKFDILNSLATLSFEGRRTSFFNKEFISILKLIDSGKIKRETLYGSWAGAIGQTQFMPTTLLNYGVDFDKSGSINLYNKVDALASGANYLSKIGWNSKIIWGEEVNLINSSKIDDLTNKRKYYSQDFWRSEGFFLKKNYNPNTKLKLISPKSKKKKFFLVSKNFDKILNWNRSYFFALSIYMLSDQINDKLEK